MAEVSSTSDTMSVLERKIIRQVEFYFGDVNLPKDKFLQEKIKEEDGWITLECLTTFNRLKQLSTDLEEIKIALRKSKNGILEISEEEYKIRRSKDRPIPDLDDPMVRKAQQMKTLYMKGFPLDYSFDEIQDFLADNEASAVYIKLRRDPHGKFKGSIFVELANIDEAEKLLSNKDLKCNDVTLKVLRREDYFKEKQEERTKAKAERLNKKVKTNDGEMGDNETEKVPIIEWKPGMVFHFENAEGLTREPIKDFFGKFEPIAWVDFNKGETQGFLRFKEQGGAQRALDSAKKAHEEGKIVIEEKELEIRVIEGEEEENFWKMAAIDDRKRSNSQAQRRHQKGGKNQRNKEFGGGKRKRPWEKNKSEKNKQSIDLDKEPKNKHTKFDSDDETDNKQSTVSEVIKEKEAENKTSEVSAEKDAGEVEPKKQG